jgi:hypothetical protein
VIQGVYFDFVLEKQKYSYLIKNKHLIFLPGLNRLRGERLLDLDRDLFRRGERDRLCRCRF